VDGTNRVGTSVKSHCYEPIRRFFVSFAAVLTLFVSAEFKGSCFRFDNSGGFKKDSGITFYWNL
jgi:hypothetical protein